MAYIRYILWVQLNHPDQSFTQNENKSSIGNKIPIINASNENLQMLNKCKNTDILLLSSYTEYREKIRDKHFLPYIDSLIDFLKKLGIYSWQNGEKNNALELLKKAYELEPYDKIININIVNMLKYYGKNDYIKKICTLYLAKYPKDKEISMILNNI